ncbi:DUF3310 domain-containing protein [Streptomyces sp. NPDC001118]|uniref:DUF3310 domain-containing protein n=1 Tax=Streptomyces sp. NPDC001127 TaxID=3154377 RepID=UPI00331C6951
MSFEVGQIVVVSKPGTVYTKQFQGERVVITNYFKGDPFPYEVAFKNGHTLGFSGEELSPLGGEEMSSDPVNRPSHYTWLPNGIEVIDITQHFNFNVGNALKYLMRAGRKGDAAEDLKKAARYIEYEINRMETS